MSSDGRLKKGLALSAVGVAAAIFAYYASSHPMDFRVYHYGARGVFDGTRPVYGPASGLGWPMHYRYPPLFLLLFAPLAFLPLGVSAAVWVVAKIAVLVWAIQGLKTRTPKVSATQFILIAALFIAPYLIEELRYGNAQLFIVALTIAALLSMPERPALAGASLGLAIAIKVWPLFFLPYLAVRREFKIVFYAVVSVVLLTLLPSLYFGVSDNFSLLDQWYEQETQTQLSQSEIWFPSQSLRGVLMRYLTTIDYSQVPDSNYPQINIATIDPAAVRLLWIVLAAAMYAGFLFLAYRERGHNDWLQHGIAFCLIALLEPFTQKYALSLLLVPAIVAAAYMQDRRVRALFCCATVVVLIQPLVPGASAQRLLQVLGMDFLATLLLTIALAAANLNLLKFAAPK